MYNTSYIYASPVGSLKISASEEGISELAFTDQASSDGVPEERNIARCVQQLGEFFAGKRLEFDLPIDLSGSLFECMVWRQIAAIPYGETITYKDIATAIGKEGGSIAVGQACGRNPVGIVIPCHRVVGSSGNLTGYAGGIEKKRWLLDHEKTTLASSIAGSGRVERGAKAYDIDKAHIIS